MVTFHEYGTLLTDGLLRYIELDNRTRPARTRSPPHTPSLTPSRGPTPHRASNCPTPHLAPSSSSPHHGALAVEMDAEKERRFEEWLHALIAGPQFRGVVERVLERAAEGGGEVPELLVEGERGGERKVVDEEAGRRWAERRLRGMLGLWEEGAGEVKQGLGLEGEEAVEGKDGAEDRVVLRRSELGALLMLAGEQGCSGC